MADVQQTTPGELTADEQKATVLQMLKNMHSQLLQLAVNKAANAGNGVAQKAIQAEMDKLQRGIDSVKTEFQEMLAA